MTNDGSRAAPNDQAEKIARILASVAGNPALAKMVSNLSGVTLLRDVEKFPIPAATNVPFEGRRTFTVLDLETTGLAASKSKILELAMINVEYHPAHGVTAILPDVFRQFEDPGEPIDESITELTGITNEMVRGQSIDQEAAGRFAASSDFIVAHNAQFDCGFAALHLKASGLDRMSWACSFEDVDWSGLHGVAKPSLERLAKHFGWDYQAHSAVADIRATAYVLASAGSLANLLERMHRPVLRLLAENSPFEKKEVLSGCGFRFASPEDNKIGRKKSWYIDLPLEDGAALAKISACLEEVYGAPRTLPVLSIPGDRKYHPNGPMEASVIGFQTSAPETILDAFRMVDTHAQPTLAL